MKASQQYSAILYSQGKTDAELYFKACVSLMDCDLMCEINHFVYGNTILNELKEFVGFNNSLFFLQVYEDAHEKRFNGVFICN